MLHTHSNKHSHSAERTRCHSSYLFDLMAVYSKMNFALRDMTMASATGTATWSCVWLFATLIPITCTATTKAMVNQSQSSKLCAGIYLFDVRWECAHCSKCMVHMLKRCENARVSIVIYCVVQNALYCNRSMFFLQMQNHFQSNTRMHTHKCH